MVQPTTRGRNQVGAFGAQWSCFVLVLNVTGSASKRSMLRRTHALASADLYRFFCRQDDIHEDRRCPPVTVTPFPAVLRARSLMREYL